MGVYHEPGDVRTSIPRAIEMSRTLVYVYDIEPPRSSIGLGVPIRDRTNDLSTVSASGPSYTSALLHQLQRYRTTLPASAHLFFVPHSRSSWWCDQPSATLDEYWRNRSTTNFWRRRGGADHFTAVHKRHVLFELGCRTRKWFRPDTPARNATKFVGVIQCPWQNGHTRKSDESVAAADGMVEVPYGCSVHNSSYWSPPTVNRPLLAAASFNAGGHRNQYQQMTLRKKLSEQCRAANTSTCRIIGLLGNYNLMRGPVGHQLMVKTVEAYRTAAFSLQPAGDDPARKAILDSLASGCIPVLFHREQRALWPLHWGPWVNDSHVFFPYEQVLAGTIDVLRAPAQISPARLRVMQASIAQNAHRLIYGICKKGSGASVGSGERESRCEQYVADDATAILLAEARRRATAADDPPWDPVKSAIFVS